MHSRSLCVTVTLKKVFTTSTLCSSLQVVHRAEFWSPFKATPLWTPNSSCWAHPPRQGSDTVKSISHQACACTDSVANIVVKRCKRIWSYDLCELQAVIALWKWMWTIMSCGLYDANCNYSVTGLFLTIWNSKTVGLCCSTYSSQLSYLKLCCLLLIRLTWHNRDRRL